MRVISLKMYYVKHVPFLNWPKPQATNTTEKRENRITLALAVNNCFTKISISISSIIIEIVLGIECVSHSKPIQSNSSASIRIQSIFFFFALLIIQWQRKYIMLFVTKCVECDPMNAPKGIQFK